MKPIVLNFGIGLMPNLFQDDREYKQILALSLVY